MGVTGRGKGGGGLAAEGQHNDEAKMQYMSHEHQCFRLTCMSWWDTRTEGQHKRRGKKAVTRTQLQQAGEGPRGWQVIISNTSSPPLRKPPSPSHTFPEAKGGTEKFGANSLLP